MSHVVTFRATEDQVRRIAARVISNAAKWVINDPSAIGVYVRGAFPESPGLRVYVKYWSNELVDLRIFGNKDGTWKIVHWAPQFKHRRWGFETALELVQTEPGVEVVESKTWAEHFKLDSGRIHGEEPNDSARPRP